jgi:nicotinamidase-related amidase
MRTTRIDPQSLGILLIDAQPFFLDEAFPGDEDDAEPLLVRLEHLLMLTQWARLPLISTAEQPISEKGVLPHRLKAVFPEDGMEFEKNCFDCTRESAIATAIRSAGVRQFAVAGSETDVCVLQSVLGLLDLEYEVFLLEDCIFTTEPNPAPALNRMYQAGATPTTLKTLAYELVGDVDDIPWPTKTSREAANPTPRAFQAPETWPPST